METLIIWIQGRFPSRWSSQKCEQIRELSGKPGKISRGKNHVFGFRVEISVRISLMGNLIFLAAKPPDPMYVHLSRV